MIVLDYLRAWFFEQLKRISWYLWIKTDKRPIDEKWTANTIFCIHEWAACKSMTYDQCRWFWTKADYPPEEE